MTMRNCRSVLIALAGLTGFGCKPSGQPARSAAVPVRPPPPRLAGMPAPVDTANIYAGAAANDLDSTARRALPRVYVPLGGAASVTEIDPATFKVLGTFPTATLPQHVVPGYDFSRLWVTNDIGNSVTPIDPITGKLGKNVPVS